MRVVIATKDMGLVYTTVDYPIHSEAINLLTNAIGLQCTMEKLA